jgi:hypothetical protein
MAIDLQKSKQDVATYQLHGPNDQENIMVTQKMKKTPPML